VKFATFADFSRGAPSLPRVFLMIVRKQQNTRRHGISAALEKKNSTTESLQLLKRSATRYGRQQREQYMHERATLASCHDEKVTNTETAH
jgi:hypothetical protein